MKKKDQTPRSRIKSAIRALSLRSRERSLALKAAGYTCARCSKKQSRAKGEEVFVEAHHKHGIKWDEVIDLIIKMVLQRPEDYEVLCKECHKEEHGGAK